MIGWALYWIALLYLGIGCAVAVCLFAGGFARLPPTPATISLPARVLLLPGAIVLWPLLLRRWLARARRGAGSGA